MSWRASFLILLSIVASWSNALGDASPTPAPTPADAKKAKTDKSSPADKKKDDKKKKKSDFTVPIPTGHDATGIRLPSYGRDGKLQMTLSIDVAKRLDDEHLQMDHVFMETYADDGSPEMSLQSVSSVMELKSRVVMSYSPTKIQRSDFEISGTHLIFDTVNRVGKFTGETRTVIYNLSQSTEPEPPKK